ncbi:hypothetical protein ACFLZ6_01090 [Nanoarchaeota archaeon]
MKASKCAVMLVLMCVSLMHGCSKDVIDEQEAVLIAQDFVNQNVKFYSEQENDATTIQQASINIIDIQKIHGEWNIKLYVQSDVGGEIKKSGLIVIVDAKTGEINKEKLSSFKV